MFWKSRHFLNVVLAITFATGWLHAAPYGPDGLETEWTQPDGTKLPLRVFGDEFYGRTETLDGYTVVFDPATKSYYYADAAADGQELLATGMAPGKGNPQSLGLAKNLDIPSAARKAKASARVQQWDEATQTSQRWSELKAQRNAYDEALQAAKTEDGPMPAPPSFTTIGNKVGLTLLIDFSDAPGTIPQANVIDYCNGDNYTGYGNNGSVKKYFQDNSKNLLTYTNTVTAYIRMAQPKSYYNDTTVDSGLRGRLLISDAIDIMKALPNYNSEILPTFDTLTVDGSNRAIACNVFFAGGNSGLWSKGLWPHSWSLASAKELSAGGKKVYKYQITNLGTSLTLGTFCHENGHMLCGYPDIYDYDGDSKGGAGGFCLMNSGGNGTNPVLINAYLKRASGWTTTTEITSSSSLTGTLVSTVGHADYNKIYRYANPAAPTSEYFIFENRQKTGRDANIAASGIAIWHIDQLGDHNDQRLTSNTIHDNYEVTLVQADNLWQFQGNTSSGDSKDLYYLGNTTAAYTNTFNDTSSPDAQWWSGTASGLYAYNFSASGASMTLQFGLPPNTISVLTPNGGEQVYFSTTQEIRWLSNTPGDVQIELYKGGSLYTVLSTGEANDGSYSWLVPAGLPAGNDYTVKISSVDTPAYTDSSNATFTLLVQPTLADALDTEGLTWTSSGNANWSAQSTTTKDGVDAAQSGAIGHSQNSYMETTIVGPGTLTFWWKVSSESGYDFLRFYLNGTEQTGSLAKISGLADWIQKTVAIPSAVYTVKWGYTKDSSTAANADAGWVDQVVYTPSAAPDIAVEQPVDTHLADGGASIDCGVINLAGPPSPVTFTVKNNGAADLTGLALTKDGSHNADFTLGSLGATTLAPGASTTFDITFLPSAEGTRTAALHIVSNDSDENPFDIALTGTGVTMGTLVVAPPGNFTSSGSYGGTPFPSTRQYTLSNPGDTPIDWTAVKTAAWVDLSATNGTLAAGANTSVTISINSNANSLAIGGYSDTVNFTNATNGNGDTTRGVSLTVNPIGAVVTLGNLSQTYDGSPKSATVTTDPSGLEYSLTYDAEANPPTNAGTYTVVATITEPNYAGGDSKDLIIAKASQTIDFAALTPVYENSAPFVFTATASSGLAVSFASSNTAVATVSGDTVTVVGLGTTTITASQAGNTNYNAASVSRTLAVVRANPLAVTGGPYNVLFGQSLSLNGSASEPSYGETIINYEWDLNNDNTFGDVTGATPAAISYNSLITTWGRVPGANTIQLRITDTSGKTSVTATSLTLITTLTWDANGTTAGQTNGAGAWLGNNLWWNGTSNLNWVYGSNAIIGGAATSGGAITLASATTVNSLILNSFTGTYTLGTAGNIITLNGGISKNSGSGTTSIISPVTLGGAQTWTNTVGSLTTSNGTNLIDNAGYDLTINGAGTTTSGVINNTAAAITGSGALVKNGSGTLSLGGANTGFTGNVTVNGGLLRVNAPVSIYGNLTLNGGVYEHYWNDAYTRTLGTGAGQIQITGGASGFSENGNTAMTVALNNSASFEVQWGGALFNPTTFVLQASTAQVSSNLTFANKLDLNGADRTISVSGGTTGAARAILSGQIRNSTGTAGLIKTGAGVLNITSSASAWNGATTIQGGILDFAGMINANIGGGSGRDITVAGGAAVRFDALTNTLLNRLVETSNEITVMTAATANNFNFGGSTGANLPNAFLGNWASNGAKCEISGTLTPASDAYRLGGKASSGLLAMVGTNKLTGARGLIVGGTGASGIRVMLADANDFSGDTVINTGAKLTLGNNLALQNSALDVGAAGGNFALNSAGTVTNATVAASPTFGGLKGSRNLLLAFTNAGGNNESNLAATAVTGFTLNLGTGNTCTYTGAIADFATGTTLTKSGQGTQIFSGANTYTGATHLNAGKLFINGSLSNTAAALNVAGGATLGGNGTLGRDVAIAAGGKLEFNISTAAASHDRLDISAGRSFAFSGASVLTINSSSGAVPGTYTLITGGNNITGTPPATLNLPANWVATVSISGNSLLLNLTSTVGDVTPPTLTSITDDKNGGPVAVSTQVTYNVTFSEDMDATTVTAADFANAGTAAVTIGSITETLTGIFTLQATPTSAGTLKLQIPVSAVLKDAAGNNLVTTSALADDTIITVNTAFDSWSNSSFADGTLSDTNAALDFDRGGLATGIEWVVGGDPTTTSDDADKAPTCDFTTDPAYLIYTYRRSDAAHADAKTAINVEYGSELSGWTAAVAGAEIIITESDDFYGTGVDKIEVKIKRSSFGTRLFTRLKVAITP